MINKLSVPPSAQRELRIGVIINRVQQLDDAVTRLEQLSDELLGDSTNEKQPKVQSRPITNTATLLAELPEMLDSLLMRMNERTDRIREGLI
jgi:hypothetical protein